MQPVLPQLPDQPLVLLDLLFKLKVKDVMSTDLITVTRTDTLRRAQEAMRASRITGVPVVEDGRLFGIVSMDDIINALEAGRLDEPVAPHMTVKVVVLEEDMPLSFGVSYFDKYRFGRFPVLNKDHRVVGILASRDVSASLLLELYKEYHRLEEQIQQPAVAPGPERALRRFAIQQYDFENAGRASHEIKKSLAARIADPHLLRRVAVAAYEMEINIVVHSRGGALECATDAHRIELTATDRGPGITNVDLAMQEGFTTANDWIKSLGFGAGMGLGNIRRVADEFSIQSGPGQPTIVRAAIRLAPPPSAATDRPSL
jgi:CBS domain-containing protein